MDLGMRVDLGKLITNLRPFGDPTIQCEIVVVMAHERKKFSYQLTAEVEECG